MKKEFKLIYMRSASLDWLRIEHFIKNECKAPLTALRYMSGLEGEISKLRTMADLRPVDPHLSEVMGVPGRRVNYKKLAILYAIDGDTVYIHHIVPQSLII